jgi:hypothetical protein
VEDAARYRLRDVCLGAVQKFGDICHCEEAKIVRVFMGTSSSDGSQFFPLVPRD